jgi:hypothetical protein
MNMISKLTSKSSPATVFEVIRRVSGKCRSSLDIQVWSYTQRTITSPGPPIHLALPEEVIEASHSPEDPFRCSAQVEAISASTLATASRPARPTLMVPQ